MSVPDPRVQVTGYQLLWLPEDDPNAFTWSVTVEWRGGDTWAVCHGPYCLDADGVWVYEIRPSMRTDEWERWHRFDYPTALRMALEAGPKLNINGLTIADLLARKAEEGTAAARVACPHPMGESYLDDGVRYCGQCGWAYAALGLSNA